MKVNDKAYLLFRIHISYRLKGFGKKHTLLKWTMHNDVKRSDISLFASFNYILLCSLYILLNFELNIKDVNINVDI